MTIFGRTIYLTIKTKGPMATESTYICVHLNSKVLENLVWILDVLITLDDLPIFILSFIVEKL